MIKSFIQLKENMFKEVKGCFIKVRQISSLNAEEDHIYKSERTLLKGQLE